MIVILLFIKNILYVMDYISEKFCVAKPVKCTIFYTFIFSKYNLEKVSMRSKPIMRVPFKTKCFLELTWHLLNNIKMQAVISHRRF